MKIRTFTFILDFEQVNFRSNKHYKIEYFFPQFKILIFKENNLLYLQISNNFELVKYITIHFLLLAFIGLS